jgi:predicted acylesterase/phospholipase RssA
MNLDDLRTARKVGLVLGGGSMRCSFQVGVIELLEELDIHPKVVVAVSGGVWSGAAVAAGTQSRLRYYWRAFARMPHLSLSSVWRDHSVFNFGELHRRTFRKYVGTERLRSPEALPLFVSVTRLRDRASVLLDARTIDDPLDLLMAANYLPPWYTYPPLVGGERYGDGGFTNNCPYERAFEEGCDAVIVVAVKGESEGGLYRSAADIDHIIPEPYASRTVVVRPRHRLPLAFTERRWERLRDIIDLGYLRGREVLLGEAHPMTGMRARGSAPTVMLARMLSRLRQSDTFESETTS